MNTFSSEYQAHMIFKELEVYCSFYSTLSHTSFGFVSPGIRSYINPDTYVYSSIQGTIDSIRLLLQNGRINDSYSLLRKYYDSAIINSYTILLLQENLEKGLFISENIQGWLDGTIKLPGYKIMSDFLRGSNILERVNEVLFEDSRYTDLRKRGNDNTHYNFYNNVLLNDSELYLKNRIECLSQFQNDVRDIFILHFTYLFVLRQHYMSSSDHIDQLESGSIPIEESQYWVAPIVQKIFTSIVEEHRPDIACIIKDITSMRLE